MYQLKWLHNVLRLDSNELLLVLGLDAHRAHKIVVRVFRDERLHGGRVYVSMEEMTLS